MAETTTTGGDDAATAPLFTARERDVYELICRRFATRAIARELSISPKTVETHRMRINKKLKTHSTCEIILRRVLDIGEDDEQSIGNKLDAILLLAKRALAGADPKAARS